MSMIQLYDKIRLCQRVIKNILWDGSNSCRICGFIEGHTKDCAANDALAPLMTPDDRDRGCACQEDATLRERFLRVAQADDYAQACLKLHQHNHASLQEALILCVEELSQFHLYMMKEVMQYNLSHVQPMTVPVPDHSGDLNTAYWWVEKIEDARAHLLAAMNQAISQDDKILIDHIRGALEALEKVKT